jgi:hypothetical protein
MATKKRLPQVKCPYCGKYFYRDIEEFVQINKTRYAHKACYDRHNAELTQEERDFNILTEFVKKLFNTDTVSEKVKRQIKDYHENKNFTYSGIYKSLVWFYQIKHTPIDKATGGIGIVPYVYDDARNYYTAQYLAQQQNQAKPIEQWKPTVVEIHIPPPVRKPMRSHKFAFLDEEEGE